MDEIFRSTKSVADALGGIGGTAYSLQLICLFTTLGFSKEHTMVTYITGLFKLSSKR